MALPVQVALSQLKDIAITSTAGDVYINATRIYNPAYTQQLPFFVVIANTVADVQRCLKIAVLTGTPIFVKSGGHSFAGYSATGSNGFVLSMEKMNNIKIKGNEITVGVGARWLDVYKAVDGTGYIPVGGCCTSVGIGGYVLGGGFGLQSRYGGGLAADKVKSFTMVTADGERVIKVSPFQNKDLFWALRGGGGGNFGVVTDITMELIQSPRLFHWTNLLFRGTTGIEAALIYIGRNMATFPKELNLDIILSKYGLSLDAVYTDKNIVEVQKTLSGFKPYRISHIIRGSNNFLKFVTQYSDQHGYVEHEKYPVYIKGAFIQKLTTNLAKSLANLKLPRGLYLNFVHLGGDIKNIAPTDTAYIHRSAEYIYYTYERYETNSQKQEVQQKAEEIFKMIKNSGCSVGGYVNYMDRCLKNWQHEYYGSNYKRLCEIKSKWNPLRYNGGLHFNQEIGSKWPQNGK